MVNLFKIPINKNPLSYVKDTVSSFIDSSSLLLLPTNRSIKEALDIGFADSDIRSISEFFQDILYSVKTVLPIELREYYLYIAFCKLRNSTNECEKDSAKSFYFSSDFITDTNYFNFINRSNAILPFFRELMMERVPFDTLHDNALYSDYSLQIDKLLALWQCYNDVIADAGFIDEWELYQDCDIDEEYIGRYNKFIFVISGYLTVSELNIFLKISESKDVYIFFNSTQLKHPQEEKIERILNSKFITFSSDDIPVRLVSSDININDSEANLMRVLFNEVNHASNLEYDKYPRFISIRGCDSDSSQYNLITQSILKNHYERGIPFNKMLVIAPDTNFTPYFIASDPFELYNVSAGQAVTDMDIASLLITIKEIIESCDNYNVRIDLLLSLISYEVLYSKPILEYLLALRGNGAIFANLCELKNHSSISNIVELIFSIIIFFVTSERACHEVIDKLLLITEHLHSAYIELYESNRGTDDTDSSGDNHFKTIKLSNISMQIHALISINQELEKYLYLYKAIGEKSKSSDTLNWILNKVLSLRVPVIKGAVPVIGVLETRNLQFDYVYIANLNRDVFPVSQDKDIFLDTAMRINLGLPTRLDRQELQKEYLYQIIFRAKEVLITYSEDDSRRCSSFVDDIAKKAGISKYSMRNKDSSIYISKGDFIFSQYSVHIKPQKNKYNSPNLFYNTDIFITDSIRNRMKVFEYSPTSLQCLISCGIKFYYMYLMKIVQPYRPVEDAEKYVISNAIHRSMNAIFKDGITPISPLYKDKVMSYFFENIKKFDYFSKLSVGEFQAEELRHEVSYLVDYERQRYSEGYRTIYSEEFFKNNFYEYSIKGVIDRIDKVPSHVSSDGLSIIDYKYKNLQSRDVADNLNIDKYDIQLPFYALLVDGKFTASVLELLYYDIKNASGTIHGFPINRLDDFKSYVLDSLSSSIHQEIFKGSDNEDVCKYCDYRMFCDKSLYDDESV